MSCCCYCCHRCHCCHCCRGAGCRHHSFWCHAGGGGRTAVPLRQRQYRAGGSGLAWRGSLARDVLPAAGLVPEDGLGVGRPAEAGDVFLRLRFCPSVVQRQWAAAGAAQPPPNPFGFATAAEELQQALGGGALLLGGSSGGAAPATERTAAASDGGPADQPCDALVALPRGTTAAQCAAARRLLQCSESLVLLTEPKDARLAPANLSAQLAPAAAPSLAVTLSSDAVALFVAVENQQQAGHFDGSGTLLLLPWEPRTLAFQPAEAGGAGASDQQPAAEGQGAGEVPAGLGLYWLQKEMAALEPPTTAATANGVLPLALHLPALLFISALASTLLVLLL